MEKAGLTFAILVGGSLLTLARRWNNPDDSAGYGIAGWTMFMCVIVQMNP